ncbi:hypothetical protein EPR50_G00153750 [Perca flavescens]|uniref:Uncharacterized protein n=1 Tax=Perca flavescens TaxID=8167 RepID=A0A484CFD9_PERFV|nr:hypothetical protein EPR50_G00153750 [Perca flavescens]
MTIPAFFPTIPIPHVGFSLFHSCLLTQPSLGMRGEENRETLQPARISTSAFTIRGYFLLPHTPSFP